MSKKKTLGEIEEEYEKLSPEMKQYIDIQVNLRAFFLKYENLPDSDNRKRDFKTEILYPRFEELKDECINREEAFDRLYKTCRNFKRNPADHLPDDPHSFYRSFDRWKSRRLREKGT